MARDADNEDIPDTPEEPRKRTRRGGRGPGGGRGLVGARRLADAVKARREEHGWTQQDVVQQGHLSLNRLQAIEAGRTAQYRRTTLEDLDRGLKWVQGSAARILYENGEPIPYESRPGWTPNEATTVTWLEDTKNMEASLAQQSRPLSDEELVNWARTTPDFASNLIKSLSQEVGRLRKQVADLEDRLQKLLHFMMENTVPMPMVRETRKSQRERGMEDFAHELVKIAGFLMVPSAREFEGIAERYNVDISRYKDPWEAADQLSRAGQHDAAQEILTVLKKYSRPSY